MRSSGVSWEKSDLGQKQVSPSESVYPASRRLVIVGDESALERDEFVASRCSWHPFEHLTGPIEATAKIRYNHPGAPATVTPPEGDMVKVKLHSPARAITSGQASVFYQDDFVGAVGGSCGE